MAQPQNRILARMLERLFAAITSGPSLNCRPHHSRQRVDLTALEAFRDTTADDALAALLGDDRSATITARVPRPAKQGGGEWSGRYAKPGTLPESEEERAYSEQMRLLTKLRVLADEAQTYEQDTGVHVLSVGFPLLSMPPGAGPGGRGPGATTRRVLAPIAFVPVTLTIKSGATPSVTIECREDEIDRVQPNEALLAWVEQQTGKKPPELFTDEEGVEPWKEIAALTAHVAGALGVEAPALFAAEHPAAGLSLVAAPKSDDAEKPAIVASAVLGLFPVANQGLLRDTQAMLEGDGLGGPVRSFLDVNVSLEPASTQALPAAPVVGSSPRVVSSERLVAQADPCQARAVALARERAGLVVHGPPGTGKSQTITNIIGDHLARGQRVLFVCDKRTALDVVANRLEHLGLGPLCAVVHDPQRDQSTLYKAIRETLETLTDAKTHPRAEATLAKVDEELQALHAELTGYHDALMKDHPATGQSFSELVGQWLAIDAPDGALDEKALEPATLAELEAQQRVLQDVFTRAERADYARNPWRDAAGLTLDALLAQPAERMRAALDAAAPVAEAADATRDEAIPPFASEIDLAQQAASRRELGAALAAALEDADAPVRASWARLDGSSIAAAARLDGELAGGSAQLVNTPLDAELSLTLQPTPPNAGEVTAQLGALEAYLAVASKWYAFLAFGKKGAAAKVLQRYGLALSPASAARVRDFLAGLRGRYAFLAIDRQLTNADLGQALPSDAVLQKRYASHRLCYAVVARLHGDAALRELVVPATVALGAAAPHDEQSVRFLQGLERSTPRAAAITKLLDTLRGTALLSAEWLRSFDQSLRGGVAAGDAVRLLRDRVDTLEDVLRIASIQAALPPSLQPAVAAALADDAPADVSLATLRRGVLATEIRRRLRADAALQRIDAHAMQTMFDRYRELDAQKRELVKRVILHRWVTRQKERLLVGTGTRLSSLGAALQRRLVTRGRNAMRLRQVLAVGENTEGGDPMFDLCPVWMASPETVAQIFPRRAVFDAVVFDEASQCRLEEALPVLTRAARVVIAGDPKQLPPTRFFETAVVESEREEATTDQELFEAQQGEVEDLLTAALSLDIEQSYLDVHYRSKNADLIEFSNEQFYGSRLQAIPGHPKNRTRFAPLTVYRADGVYEERVNEAEADLVVKIVGDLLKRAEPPSIGVACFNVAQRDLIVEKLEERAAEDEAFARKLAAARERRGKGSFEGLFVKNLENVQGDERDHMIISTTYGPTPEGKFYRRFGPLGMAGGGRRLNVLVTRAREEVHLVTSIPREVYAALPPVPSGQQAGGGWLLFAYLHYAEQLAEAYDVNHRVLEQADAAAAPRLHVRKTGAPSPLAESLAARFARGHRIGSDVYWGNDGFCVDVALQHPTRIEDVTLGVLCDATRFPLAQDPVEWDVFRTGVLEGQGWQLQRVWSPQLFRDPQGRERAIVADAAKLAAATTSDADALPVERPRP